MSTEVLGKALSGMWLALAVVWAAAAVTGKRTARKEPAGSRIGHILTMAVSFGLLFSPAMRPGPLGWRLVPSTGAAAAASLTLTAAGVLFAIWARFCLGGNWSAIVAVKQGHKLVRRGPYRLVRHPIYAGLLLAMAGTAIGFGGLGGFLAVAIALAGFLAKARAEESFMLEEFGAGYEEYRSRVRALIPFVL
jgi:protein-S-isoprenylcysteine O-methyltransferase